jgi:guanylate kinase
MSKKNKLVILTGPSCAGKTPLEKSLRHLHPDISHSLKRLVAYNSRAMRPVEKEGIDYYFRSRQQMEDLAEKKIITLIAARGDLHGFDLEELKNLLKQSDAFYEGNTFMALEMLSIAQTHHIDILSIFLSPFSQNELRQLAQSYDQAGLEEYIYKHMLHKLVRRAENFKINLNEKILDNLKHRARDAYQELTLAHNFDHIIVNHDGEDSSNWDDPENLSGDAAKSVNSLASLLVNGSDDFIENWPPGFLNETSQKR